MHNRIELIRRIIAMGLLVSVGMFGCGWPEADAVVTPDPDRSEQMDDSEVDKASGGDTAESIRHPFRTTEGTFRSKQDDNEETPQSEDESDETPPPENESDETLGEPCGTYCLKSLACHDDVADDTALHDCMDGCDYALYEKMVDEEIFECIGESNDCEEVAGCWTDIQACDDACQWHETCEQFDERAECIRWCAGELRAGNLDWDAYGCLIDTVEGSCPAFGLCGVTPPEM